MQKNNFLRLVAQDLIARFGTDLSDVTVVFPGIRTSLFFNTYLYQVTQKPLWAPQYRSIESLFAEAATLRTGDSIQLIVDLYETYIEVYNAHSQIPSAETLDEFFFFGEILLSDFEDVDKNLVNANALFANLKDLDALRDNFEHLSEEQREAIQRHFQAFQGETALKTAFWNIWNILGEVYEQFREKLRAKNVAYQGMLMRSVVDNEGAVFNGKQYVFVGFNVLSKSEERLFKLLKPNATFYWDYDQYYLQTEAGRFIRQNILQFGSALDDSCFDTFLQTEKKITFLASPSESGQAATIPQWIDSLQKSPDFAEPDSAIVLCNETILPVVMHAIPSQKVENVNITMGFPITQTAICSYLQVLTEMQTKGYRPKDGTFWIKYTQPVLQHPYTAILFPNKEDAENNPLLFTYAPDTESLAKQLLEIIQQVGQFYEKDESDTYAGLYQESIFRAYQVVNRLYGLITTKNLKVGKPVFLRLLRKLLSTVQIPFHGEPVKGLQIMGILETRGLDFKNLLLLNVNEGFMPGGTNENTFIPQFLRSHFEMNTIDHQDSLFAYYFYRLIQRAEQITLVYHTDQTTTGKAEISRFLLQLLVDPKLKNQIQRFALQSSIQPRQPETLVIEKDAELLQTLKNQYDINTNPEAYRLSPTALNTYIDCGYKFYWQYVKGLQAQEEITDDLDASVFGSIFHKAAEIIYRNNFLEYLEFPHKIRQVVLQAFEELYFKKPVKEEDFNGEQWINFQVICKLLERLLHYDKKRLPFNILGLEYRVSEIFALENQNIAVKIGGIIDRLEEKDGNVYIVDYKTGGKAKECRSLEDLFVQKDNRAAHIFQTFVYATALLQQKNKNRPIIPALLYIQQMSKPDYSPVVVYDKMPVSNFRELLPPFKALLLEKIEEIFDATVPFQQTAITNTCEYCDFRTMCNR
jgi:hypothetical protein